MIFKKKVVVFIGPLPPPVHGFSLINQKMLELLSGDSEVKSFNVRPVTMRFGSKVARMLRLTLFPLLIFKFLITCILNRKLSLYVGFSGGMGQIFDCFFISIARIFKIKTFLHHHSFAYLNSARWYNRVVFYLSANAQHIVLCDSMGEDLARIYGISPKNITVVSNVAFMPVENEIFMEPSSSTRIGYIANISAQKGIFEFLDLVDSLADKEYKIEAKIAGPIDMRIKEDFHSRISNNSKIKYVGPVYGAEKENFYKNLDVLVFPTKYVNEAEPLILWEAMAKGVAVVSIARGCIACTIPSTVGAVAKSVSDFPLVAFEEVSRMASDPAFLLQKKQAAYKHFCSVQQSSKEKLKEIIGMITDKAVRS